MYTLTGDILVDITTADSSLLNVYDNIVGIFKHGLGTIFDHDVLDLAEDKRRILYALV